MQEMRNLATGGKYHTDLTAQSAAQIDRHDAGFCACRGLTIVVCATVVYSSSIIIVQYVPLFNQCRHGENDLFVSVCVLLVMSRQMTHWSLGTFVQGSTNALVCIMNDTSYFFCKEI